MPEIRFDDFAALRFLAGNDFGPWGPELIVTQRMIDDFAALTGDRGDSDSTGTAHYAGAAGPACPGGNGPAAVLLQP